MDSELSWRVNGPGSIPAISKSNKQQYSDGFKSLLASGEAWQDDLYVQMRFYVKKIFAALSMRRVQGIGKNQARCDMP